MFNDIHSNDRAIQLETLLDKIKHLGILLSAEKDSEKLIRIILEESVNIIGCDAGSIYILDAAPCLRFKASVNLSRKVDFEAFSIPINHDSISGYCAETGETVILNNLHDYKNSKQMKHDSSFDKIADYHTVNMMVIPMKDIHNEVLGVLQLINKKRNPTALLYSEDDFSNEIIPFDEDEASLILAISSQAGMLIERSKLHKNIEDLFYNFVRSMVLLIDKRDPCTAGHSIRVAEITEKFIKRISETPQFPFENIYYTADQQKEIYYAALLHDIGKIGVNEQLLSKRTKLDKNQMAYLKLRFKYIKGIIEQKRTSDSHSNVDQLTGEEIDKLYAFIDGVNEKNCLEETEIERIRQLGNHIIEDFDGEQITLLTADEIESLSIRCGNLTYNEREKMMSHPVHTFEILNQLNWTKDLERLPLIASAHHEKIDGSGYPHHLSRMDIPFESKILAIADIYEALTAEDRPYRRGMTHDDALKVLIQEATLKHLDKDLVDFFITERVYEKENTF